MPCDMGHYNEFMSLFRKAYCICHPTWSSGNETNRVMKVKANAPSYSTPSTHVLFVSSRGSISSQPLPSQRSLHDAERLERLGYYACGCAIVFSPSTLREPPRSQTERSTVVDCLV